MPPQHSSISWAYCLSQEQQKQEPRRKQTSRTARNILPGDQSRDVRTFQALVVLLLAVGGLCWCGVPRIEVPSVGAWMPRRHFMIPRRHTPFVDQASEYYHHVAVVSNSLRQEASSTIGGRSSRLRTILPWRTFGATALLSSSSSSSSESNNNGKKSKSRSSASSRKKKDNAGRASHVDNKNARAEDSFTLSARPAQPQPPPAPQKSSSSKTTTPPQPPDDLYPYPNEYSGLDSVLASPLVPASFVDWNGDDPMGSTMPRFPTASTLEDFYAAEDDDELMTLLEEREDRLYVDANGVKRKVETCLLVGAEDLSSLRKQHQEASSLLAVANTPATSTDNTMMMDLTAHDLAERFYQQSVQPPIGTNMPTTLSSPSLTKQQQQFYYQPPLQLPWMDDLDIVFTLEDSMAEMRELIKTAGMDLVGEVVQRMHQINPKTYIGTGKVKEVSDLLKEKDCKTVVFDAELTPGQQKALENAFNKKALTDDFFVQEGDIKVIDRTALILDIFAQHARTKEGKLQVELALTEYRKPRLTRMWTHLERQSAGAGASVGLRGPGERQLEMDKRMVRDRILSLQEKIDTVQKQRTMRRRGRDRLGLPLLSLVGYTNAGKSSMLNALTQASVVMAESMLFATLDPTTRKVTLPGARNGQQLEALLTDTVGFIQKLPTTLVAAFRATLEEVNEADVLIHVIDVASPVWQKQEQAVLAVLASLGALNKPMVRVLNKMDLLEPGKAEYLRYQVARNTDDTVVVSALHGTGMDDFVAVVEHALSKLLVPIEALIPYSKGDELNCIHQQGKVELVDYREQGTYIQAMVPRAIAHRVAAYSVATPQAGPETAAASNDDGIDWIALGRGRHSPSNDKDMH